MPAANGVPPFGELCDGAQEAADAACEAGLSGTPSGSSTGIPTGSLTRSPAGCSGRGARGNSAPEEVLPSGVGALAAQHSLQLHRVQVRACRASVPILRNPVIRGCRQEGRLVELGRWQGRDADTLPCRDTPPCMRRPLMNRVLPGMPGKGDLPGSPVR